MRSSHSSPLLLSALLGLTLASCGRDRTPSPEEFPIAAESRGTIGVPLESAREWDAVSECEVHRAPLTEAEIAVFYGMPYMGSAEFYAARSDTFPYACSKLTGDCGGSGPASATVKRCEKCTVLELEWNSTQRDD